MTDGRSSRSSRGLSRPRELISSVMFRRRRRRFLPSGDILPNKPNPFRLGVGRRARFDAPRDGILSSVNIEELDDHVRVRFGLREAIAKSSRITDGSPEDSALSSDEKDLWRPAVAEAMRPYVGDGGRLRLAATSLCVSAQK